MQRRLLISPLNTETTDTMQILRAESLEQLEPLAEAWDTLAGGMPFRTWAWMSSWWRHYGQDADPRRRLCVVCVLDDHGTPLAIAPWYVSPASGWDRVVRFLGSGDVCSEYLGVLCRRGAEDTASDALAEWLLQRCSSAPAASDDPSVDGWGLLELTDMAADDQLIAQLARRLAEGGSTIHRREGAACWRVELPITMDEYLGRMSKNGRRQCRRLWRRLFDSGRAVLHTARNAGEFSQAMDTLIELHTRRSVALGRPGCFASARFTAFHREAAQEMFRCGQAQLHVLDCDGRPIAAEYELCGNGVMYAYQSGIDPARLALEPGRACQLAVMRWAIENGYHAYDMLRGDEPYKRHWLVERRRVVETRVVAPRIGPRLCHAAWLAGVGTKQWIKKGLDQLRT